jgi:hypothetical protein
MIEEETPQTLYGTVAYITNMPLGKNDQETIPLHRATAFRLDRPKFAVFL